MNKNKKRLLIAAVALVVVSGLTYLVVVSVQNIQALTARDRAAVTQTRQAIEATCKPGAPKVDCWQLVGAGTPDDLTTTDGNTVIGKVQFGNLGVCTLPVSAPVDNPAAVKITLTVRNGSSTELVTPALSDVPLPKLRQARRDYDGLGYCFLGN